MDNEVCKSFTNCSQSIINRLLTKVKVCPQYSDERREVIALWDTGATNSSISVELAAEMNLISTGSKLVHTAGGLTTQQTYLMDIILPNDVRASDIVVSGAQLRKQGFDILIGMDIITRGDFAVSNHEHKTVFTFRMPSQKVTDYCKQIHAQNIIGQTHGIGNKKRRKK